MSTAISIRQLVKTFPGGLPGSGSRTTVAVDHVDLEIAPGELFFLLGPSGCGKTTLLRMIAGFIDPTSGAVAFRDAAGTEQDVTHWPPNKRNTGMVFQSYALWPHMTVGANVAFGLTVRKVPAAERDQRVREALAIVRMDAYIDRKPNQLSGGQQQRVALARALVVRPSVLLLDEPLSNLDAKLRIELRSEIRRICKDAGLTTVYVTHDQKEALSMADRIALMRSGRLEQVGSPRDLYARPRSRFAAEFLGESNFLEGTVQEVSPDGVVSVTTPAGTVSAPALFHVERGKPVVVSIRHEGVALTSTSQSTRGIVDSATFLGDATHVVLRLPGGQSIAALVRQTDTGVHVGDPVGIQLDPIAVAILPAADRST